MIAPAILVDEYVAALDRSSRADAVGVAARARASGAGVWEIGRDLIARAQRQVGERWQRNEWTVADEHAATLIGDIALTAVAGSSDPPVHGTAVAACVDGEWHALPLRILCEGLRELGWDVVELGASLPADQLTHFLEARQPDAALLSASMPGRLPAARDAVAAAVSCGIPALVGGAAVQGHPGRAERIGAVAGDSDVHRLHDQLLDVTGRSVPGGGPPSTSVRRPVPAPVPPVSDELAAVEHPLLARARREVAVRAGPGPGEWESLLLGSVPELIAALEAAALLDDPSVLDGELRWLGAALAARDAPPGALDHALDAVERAVDDLAPAATRLLEAAR